MQFTHQPPLTKNKKDVVYKDFNLLLKTARIKNNWGYYKIQAS